MSPDQENRGNQPESLRPTKLGYAAAAVGVVVLAVGTVYVRKEYFENDQTGVRISDSLPEGMGGSDVTAKLPTHAELHNIGRDLNETYSTRRGTESVESLRNDLAKITMQKVKAYQDSVGDINYSALSVADDAGWVVNLADRGQFDLDDQEDLAIGAAIVDYYFQLRFREELEAGVEYYYPTQRGSSDAEENLLWLSDNIKLELGDVPPLLEVRSLEELALGIKALDELGIKEPKKVSIVDYYSGVNTDDESDSETLVIRASSYFSSGAFEARFAIGEHVVNGDRELQEKYSELLDKLFGESGEIRDASLTSSSYSGSFYDDKTELGFMVADYLFDGVGLRKRILYAKETGHAEEAKILEAKYNFIKNEKFGGREYSINGKQKKYLTYSLGDVVEVDDYEADRPGIYLRETPILEIDPERSSISGSSQVKIVEGPVVVVSDGYPYEQATRMWKVQDGNVQVDGRIFVPYEGREGWVSEEWLAEKVNEE